jgi:hypothetical protein
MTQQQFGRATEARFTFDASLRGLNVARPVDSLPGYDVIVDTGRRMFRVQVKGAHRNSNRAYTINIQKHKTRNRTPEFDLVAVWLHDDARWMFLPRNVRRRALIRVTAGGKYSRTGWEIFNRKK